MKHIKIFEQFDDYELDDIFGSPEEFEVGDYVTFGSLVYYWDDSKTTFGKAAPVENNGHWSEIYNDTRTSERKIKEISDCKDVNGYTGKIIKFESPWWPWFQTTNIIKI